MRGTPEERFFAKVTKTPTCWIWSAGRCGTGYGQFYLDGRIERAHRVAYRWLVGEIPAGLELDHLCRVRECVNPAHLEAVTRQVNVQRGASGAFNIARAMSQTHCKRGHEFTPENTWINPTYGHRHCRACVKVRKQERTAAILAA